MNYYIYAYINRNTGFPYYIGKGCGNRAYIKRGRKISTPKDKSKIIIMEKNKILLHLCSKIYYHKKIKIVYFH